MRNKDFLNPCLLQKIYWKTCRRTFVFKRQVGLLSISDKSKSRWRSSDYREQPWRSYVCIRPVEHHLGVEYMLKVGWWPLRCFLGVMNPFKSPEYRRLLEDHLYVENLPKSSGCRDLFKIFCLKKYVVIITFWSSKGRISVEGLLDVEGMLKVSRKYKTF